MASATYVGCAAPATFRRQCYRSLNFLEVQDTFFVLPKLSVLERWRQEAPDEFVFTMKAWQLITHPADSAGYRQLPAGTEVRAKEVGLFRLSELTERAFSCTLRAASALAARAIIFETPPQFTPTTIHRRHISSFFEKIDRRAAPDLVWHPRGVWESQEVRRLCADLGLTPSIDPTRDDEALDELGGPIHSGGRAGTKGYLRLLAPRYSERDLTTVLTTLACLETAFCAFGSSRMIDDAERLLSLTE